MVRLVIFEFPSKNTREFLSNLHPVIAFTLIDVIGDGFGYLIQIVFTYQQRVTHQFRQPVVLAEPFRVQIKTSK